MPDKRVDVKCVKCGKMYSASETNYKKRLKNGKPLYCQECGKIEAAKAHSERYHNMTPEEKEKWSKVHSAGQKKRYANMSKEERKESVQAMRKGLDNWKENLTEEGWEDFKRKALDGKKNMSKEAYDQMVANMSKGMNRYYASMNDEDCVKMNETLKKAHEASKQWWEGLTPEERQRRLDELHENADKWRSKLTPEEMKEHTRAGVEKLRELWADKEWSANKSAKIRESLINMTPEAKILRLKRWREVINEPEHKMKYRALRRQLWLAKSAEERKSHVRKTLTASVGKNKVHRHFELVFDNSTLKDHFHYKTEIVLGTESIHSWDYGIYDENGELVMVVDLDGAYFHADICDYDGVHSREEYDERRGLSVPNGVIPVIINEKNFDNTFEYMIKMLSMTYDQYMNHMFQTYRRMPFPEPKYSMLELVDSYDRLCRLDCNDKYHQDMSVNTRLGDRLILHFHPSIYQQSVDGHMSPYDAWHNDDVLRQHIQDHILYHSYLNPNKILQGFNVSDVAPRIRFLSGGKAKMIINKYLMDYDVIFDPNMGYGGTMLGTVSLGKKFVGICSDDTIRRENETMVKFIKDHFIIDVDMNTADTTYPCILTVVNSDDEIDELIHRYKCDKYIFLTEYTETYNKYILDVIESRTDSENDYYVISINQRES